MTHKEIQELLIKANKAGRKGVRVIDFYEPTTAASYGYALVTTLETEQNDAGKLPWWLK